MIRLPVLLWPLDAFRLFTTWQIEQPTSEGTTDHANNVQLQYLAGRFGMQNVCKFGSHISLISLISKTVVVWFLLWTCGVSRSWDSFKYPWWCRPFLYVMITAIAFNDIYHWCFLIKHTIMVVKRPGNNMHSNLTYESLSSKPGWLIVLNILKQRNPKNFRVATFVAVHAITILINEYPSIYEVLQVVKKNPNLIYG